MYEEAFETAVKETLIEVVEPDVAVAVGADGVESWEPLRVTVIVYVEGVPSCAVTRTCMVFEPTFKDKASVAEPDVTGVKDPVDPRRTPIVAFA